MSTVTVSFGTDKTVETVHDYKVGDEKKIAGPYNSTLNIKSKSNLPAQVVSPMLLRFIEASLERLGNALVS